ncbi:MAG: hypothetical protein Q4B59_03020 [Lachnospiraceae bacterium]|nr:hypothetical protein [Lachnospiraceae bacterium]
MKESDYEDIIHLPPPTSRKHPRMPGEKRAAQFAPFAALVGYEAAVDEAARLTSERTELTEEERGRLDQTLQLLMERRAGERRACITRFIPDERKEGGSYASICGSIRRLDPVGRILIMEDGLHLKLDDIVEIEVQGGP